MTPGQLQNRLSEFLPEGYHSFHALTVPELMHIKAEFDRLILDAISDEATPCPHSGTRWHLYIDDTQERCGQCGRVLAEVSEAANE